MAERPLPSRAYEQTPIDRLLSLDGITERLAQLAIEARNSASPRKGGRSHTLAKIEQERKVLQDLSAAVELGRKLDEVIESNNRVEQGLQRKAGAGAQRASKATPFGVIPGAKANSG